MLNSITQRAKCNSITAVNTISNVSRKEMHVLDCLFLPENVCKIHYL